MGASRSLDIISRYLAFLRLKRYLERTVLRLTWWDFRRSICSRDRFIFIDAFTSSALMKSPHDEVLLLQIWGNSTSRWTSLTLGLKLGALDLAYLSALNWWNSIKLITVAFCGGLYFHRARSPRCPSLPEMSSQKALVAMSALRTGAMQQTNELRMTFSGLLTGNALRLQIQAWLRGKETSTSHRNLRFDN